MNAEAAAAIAVATAELSAAAAIAQARIGYALTYNMIKQDQGALSFPLIALSFAAITQGLVAYVKTQVAAVGVSSGVTAQMKGATLACQESFQAAMRAAKSGTK